MANPGLATGEVIQKTAKDLQNFNQTAIFYQGAAVADGELQPGRITHQKQIDDWRSWKNKNAAWPTVGPLHQLRIDIEAAGIKWNYKSNVSKTAKVPKAWSVAHLDFCFKYIRDSLDHNRFNSLNAKALQNLKDALNIELRSGFVNDEDCFQIIGAVVPGLDQKWKSAIL